MRKYIVQITDTALEDMEAIYTYIAEQLRSPDHAMKQYNRIARAIEGLEIFPERVKLMDSCPERRMGLRQLVIDHYFIFYVIRDQRVIVTRVLYSASNIEKRLWEKTSGKIKSD